MLLEISTAPEVPTQTRLVAVMYLKNNIQRYWQAKADAPSMISDEEKATVRTRILLSITDEQDQNTATQKALLVAKIARSDFPEAWPTIFDDISSQLAANAAPLGLQQTMLVLHFVLRDLSSKCLVKDRKQFRKWHLHYYPSYFSNGPHIVRNSWQLQPLVWRPSPQKGAVWLS